MQVASRTIDPLWHVECQKCSVLICPSDGLFVCSPAADGVRRGEQTRRIINGAIGEEQVSSPISGDGGRWASHPVATQATPRLTARD